MYNGCLFRVRLSLIILFAIGFPFVAPSLLIAGPTEDHKDPHILDLCEKADRILQNLKKTCDAFHLTYVGPAKFIPSWTTTFEPNDLISVTGPTIRMDATAHQFTFREADGRMVGYLNTLLINDVPQLKVNQDHPVIPQWSEKEAISIATAFKDVFVFTEDVHLGTPRAEYLQNSELVSVGGKLTNAKQYRAGQWMICWPRVDGNGHPFYGDHVTIQIQEGYAPLGVGAFLTTPYLESKMNPISETDALARATSVVNWRQFGMRLAYHFVRVDDYERNVTGNQILGESLEVVLPNPPHSFLSYFMFRPQTAAGRLAWVIWFRPIHSSKPPATGWYDEDFSVHLDAYTGEVIGGDAML